VGLVEVRASWPDTHVKPKKKKKLPKPHYSTFSLDYLMAFTVIVTVVVMITYDINTLFFVITFDG
jgi:hypothetical protein